MVTLITRRRKANDVDLRFFLQRLIYSEHDADGPNASAGADIIHSSTELREERELTEVVR